MGLDQWAWYVLPDDSEAKELPLASWRKHNRLEGWMCTLWYEKGCPGICKTPVEFNCVKLELTSEDLHQLKDTIEHMNLPLTNGFFFGNDSYNEDYDEYGKEYDLTFIEEALEVIEEEQGKVFYMSSW